MAKRFTDSTIFRQSWFSKLTPEMKCVWFFLCAECDHAGFWEVNIEYLNFSLKTNLTLKAILSELTQGKRERIKLITKHKLFITGFIEFQYKCKPHELNPAVNAHKSAIAILKKERVWEGLVKGSARYKDKDMEEDKDTEIDKDIEMDRDTDKDRIAKIRRSISRSLHNQ